MCFAFFTEAERHFAGKTLADECQDAGPHLRHGGTIRRLRLLGVQAIEFLQGRFRIAGHILRDRNQELLIAPLGASLCLIDHLVRRLRDGVSPESAHGFVATLGDSPFDGRREVVWKPDIVLFCRHSLSCVASHSLYTVRWSRI